MKDESVDTAFAAHERELWGLAYRMTASAADADEIVQDTFVRALERPVDRSRPLRPWLRKVALNLARDRLRRRKNAPYVGEWLPEPVLSDELLTEGQRSPEARYELRESLTYAFLRAMEALTADQRAVLLLRDVYELSVREAADALELSESNVKVLAHRARHALRDYDESPCRPDADRVRRTQLAMATLLGCLGRGDVDGARAAMAEDVQVVSDAAGEFTANRKTVHGAAKAATFLLRIRDPDVPVASRVVLINGLPALWMDWQGKRTKNHAQQALVRVEVDEKGSITRVESILATAKLSRLGAAL
ncbi:MAG: sigma-70 family RNA polymerase sigma factor [Myxococcota bacterium]